VRALALLLALSGCHGPLRMKLSRGAKGHARIKANDRAIDIEYRVLDANPIGDAEIEIAATGWPKGRPPASS
jgi:hypothetical protein